MAWDKSWTRCNYQVTEDMIRDVEDYITGKIDEAGGEAYIKIGEDILGHFGLKDQWRKWYGTYWEAVREAIKRSGIGYEKCGRKGGRYFYLVKPVSGELNNETEILKSKIDKIKQIKTLMNNLSIENLTLDEANNILNITEKIIS